MTEYIDQIEKFLRGQMSKEEESVFKTSLSTDEHLQSFAFVVAHILRAHQI